MNRETFRSFVQMYRDTYGENSMSSETAQMWYDNLKHLEPQKFGHAVQDLLGKEKFKFQWHRVVEKVDLLYPKDNAIKSEWRDSDTLNSNADKKKELTRYMDEIITKIRRKEAGTWREDYARKMLEVWGVKEFERQAHVLDGEANFRDFAKVMRKVKGK